MAKTIPALFLLSLLAIQVANALSAESIREVRIAARGEMQEDKAGTAQSAAVPGLSDFNDTASFGKNVEFLGSLYAGTLFVYRRCDPQILVLIHVSPVG